MTYRSDSETLASELIARIERQSEIICELLARNEQLRNRLCDFEQSSQSRLTQQRISSEVSYFPIS